MQNKVVELKIFGSMCKHAGLSSELIGMFANPVNAMTAPISIPAGLIAGASMKKLTKQELEDADSKKWSNILIPGMAQYRLARRIKAGG